MGMAAPAARNVLRNSRRLWPTALRNSVSPAFFFSGVTYRAMVTLLFEGRSTKDKGQKETALPPLVLCPWYFVLGNSRLASAEGVEVIEQPVQPDPVSRRRHRQHEQGQHLDRVLVDEQVGAL